MARNSLPLPQRKDQPIEAERTLRLIENTAVGGLNVADGTEAERNVLADKLVDLFGMFSIDDEEDLFHRAIGAHAIKNGEALIELSKRLDE